jgi:colanic acid biosynthesis glycosyl transferase WcaI
VHENTAVLADPTRAHAERETPRVWLVSAVQHENVESTTHIFARLADALGERYEIGVLAPPPAPPAAAPGQAAFARWFADRFRRALVGSLRVFARALGQVKHGDVLLVVTNPPMLPVLMSAVARLRRARLIVVVHDVYPDVLYATGLMPAHSIAGRILDRLARAALRRADRVIVIGRDMKRRIAAKLGGADHVVYIPNWADPHIAPAALSTGTHRPLIVQYSGNMGVTHPVETLLDCAEILQEQDAPVHFQVFGWGLKLPLFRAEIDRRGLRNVSLGPRCPRAELGAQLAGCDIGLVLMRRGMAGISVPCRAYNIMAAGRPLIAAADDDAEIALTVVEHGLGWVVPPEDPHALAAAIHTAAERRPELAATGMRAAAVVAAAFSFDHTVAQYGRVVDELTAAASPPVTSGDASWP